MSRPSNILLPAINYDHTLVLSVELSNKSWVLAAQVPGLPRTKAQRTIEPNKNALLAAIDGYRLIRARSARSWVSKKGNERHTASGRHRGQESRFGLLALHEASCGSHGGRSIRDDLR
jgi:hypothetical protein